MTSSGPLHLPASQQDSLALPNETIAAHDVLQPFSLKNEADVSDEEGYYIEKIVDEIKRKEKGQERHQYKVKWEGYSESHASWIDAHALEEDGNASVMLAGLLYEVGRRGKEGKVRRRTESFTIGSMGQQCDGDKWWRRYLTAIRQSFILEAVP